MTLNYDVTYRNKFTSYVLLLCWINLFTSLAEQLTLFPHKHALAVTSLVVGVRVSIKCKVVCRGGP